MITSDVCEFYYLPIRKVGYRIRPDLLWQEKCINSLWRVCRLPTMTKKRKGRFTAIYIKFGPKCMMLHLQIVPDEMCVAPNKLNSTELSDIFQEVDRYVIDNTQCKEVSVNTAETWVYSFPVWSHACCLD